jgi:hypothetical protein
MPKDPSGYTVYQTAAGYESDRKLVIIRMALHRMESMSNHVGYKEQQFQFRVVFRHPERGYWRYSCLGSDVRGTRFKMGRKIGVGSYDAALKWLWEGEEI